MSERLIGLSRRIHANPETAFEEYRACAWVAEELADAGFAIERGICATAACVLRTIGSNA